MLRRCFTSQESGMRYHEHQRGAQKRAGGHCHPPVIGTHFQKKLLATLPYTLPEYFRTAHSTVKKVRITKKIHFRLIKSFRSSSAVITGL